MDTLYLMVTITDRKLEKKFLNFYREQGLEVSLTTLGHGTASSEIPGISSAWAEESEAFCFIRLQGKIMNGSCPL